MTGDLAIEHFLEICDSASWTPGRIPESTEQESADYLVTAEGTIFLAEIKQLNPNREEREKERQIQLGKVVVHHHTPGDRLRPLIKKANRQIRALAAPGQPGLLVVYDTRRVSPVEPYDALTAMYGLQNVVLNVHPDPRVPPSYAGNRFGGGRSVSSSYNRSVSALGIVPQQPRPARVMYVFHNAFAASCLPSEILRIPGFRQFRRPHSESSDFNEWQEF